MSQSEVFFAIGECSLGVLLVARSRGGLCALLLGDDPQELKSDLGRRFRGARIMEDAQALEGLLEEARRLVEQPGGSFSGALDLQGTEFQRRVWAALLKVPPGRTTSYGALARELGVPGASRAVGSAVGANPVAVVVPCHRVIGSDGGLAGYRWGVERKRWLLERERRG